MKEEIAKTIETNTRVGKVFIGWDGNTDELLDVVDVRTSEGYDAIQTMEKLGMRIVKAGGKSCNIELIPKRTKLGGNGPILARALVEGGHKITLVGCVGAPELEELFKPLTDRCERVISLAPSALTQALEFNDGKVMLGKLQSFDQITWENLQEKIPDFQQIHEELDLFVSANWTMLLDMNRIWKKIADEIMPKLSTKQRFMFVDLADPAKRSDEDVREGLAALSKLSERYDVALGLNASEGGRVAKVLGVDHLEGAIRQKLGLAMVIGHSSHGARIATESGTFEHEGPYCATPAITTGAGDNFNAGFCNGLLMGLDPQHALVCGIAASGFYVRNGHSPTMTELPQFLRDWEAGKLA